jgi:acetolactate synthase-1/2/3 large subunit
VIDIPKDVQFATGAYIGPERDPSTSTYRPRTKGDPRDRRRRSN